MTLAKAVVTGIVYKTPKTGFTSNNVAVSSFVLNIGTQDEILVRVISKRNSLESVVQGLSKNQKVLVEGRLQNGISKMDDGTEKRKIAFSSAKDDSEVPVANKSVKSSAKQKPQVLEYAQVIDIEDPDKETIQ